MKGIVNAVKWVAAALEDQSGGGISSKRVSLYVALFYLYLIVKGSLDGKKIDEMVLWGVIVLILITLGVITSEFFKDSSFLNPNKNKDGQS
jgi:uncharacterized membrane protein